MGWVEEEKQIRKEEKKRKRPGGGVGEREREGGKGKRNIFETRKSWDSERSHSFSCVQPSQRLWVILKAF